MTSPTRRSGSASPNLREKLGDLIARGVKHEDLDLIVLVLAAGTLSVLGLVGRVSADSLTTLTVAVLAALAFSQLKSRRKIDDMSLRAGSGPDVEALLRDDFPANLAMSRAQAHSFVYLGTSMVRTAHASRDDIRKILAAGGRVRVMVLNPLDRSLLANAYQHDATEDDLSLFQSRIRSTLSEMERLRSAGGDLEIRVTNQVPRVSINAIDIERVNGRIYFQHYEYRPAGEPAPIVELSGPESKWFVHFRNEVERIWNSGVAWPLTPAQQLVPDHAKLKTSTSDLLVDFMETATTVDIVGVSRNAFVNDHFKRLESRLQAGVKMRFLLVNPDSAAIQIAADRYYAKSASVDALQSRVNETLNHLRELQALAPGGLRVFLTDHPVAVGMIAFDVRDANSDLRSIFAEYYSFRTSFEPTFALSPLGGDMFDHFAVEMENLFEAASEIGPPLSLP